MTLDRCVQRLRKRLSDQSHAAHEAVLQNLKNNYSNNGDIHRHNNNNNIFKRDSFYTTQSLVNLSGKFHVCYHHHSSTSSSLSLSSFATPIIIIVIIHLFILVITQ